jgi:hypothetical protein
MEWNSWLSSWSTSYDRKSIAQLTFIFLGERAVMLLGFVGFGFSFMTLNLLTSRVLFFMKYSFHFHYFTLPLSSKQTHFSPSPPNFFSFLILNDFQSDCVILLQLFTPVLIALIYLSFIYNFYI